MKEVVSVEMENGIDDIVAGLYNRVVSESVKILIRQLKQLGIGAVNAEVVRENCTKKDHVGDPRKLTTYFYKNRPLLTVMISEKQMGIEFEVYNLESQEDQNGAKKKGRSA